MLHTGTTKLRNTHAVICDIRGSASNKTGREKSENGLGVNFGKFPWARSTDSFKCGKRKTAQFCSFGIFQ